MHWQLSGTGVSGGVRLVFSLAIILRSAHGKVGVARQGRTALMSAAQLGDPGMAELLIAAGAGASVDATCTESG